VIDGCDGLVNWLADGESGQYTTCPALVESGWAPLSSNPKLTIGTSVDVSPIRTDFHCCVIAVTNLFTVGVAPALRSGYPYSKSMRNTDSFLSTSSVSYCDLGMAVLLTTSYWQRPIPEGWKVFPLGMTPVWSSQGGFQTFLHSFLTQISLTYRLHHQGLDFWL
jgi:hypothetical protein